MRLTSLLAVATLSITATGSLQAAPWINTQDAYLHQSIQQLANAGLIKTPINTLPLMWQPILQDLANVDVNQLTSAQQHAFYRVQAAASFAQKDIIKFISVHGASDPIWQGGYGQQHLQEGQVSLGTELIGGNWSAGIHKQFNYNSFVNAANSPTNTLSDNKSSWNNSYAAYTAGNWVLVAALQQQWWGPGINSSFNQNANQQATRSLQLNRLNPNTPLHEKLAWLGPVGVNVQYGYYSGTDILRHANYFSSRLSFKPVSRLELGLNQRSIKPKLHETVINFAPLTQTNINSFGADLSVNLTAEAALYGEVSQQQANKQIQSATAYMIGAKYHLGNQHVLMRFYSEYQQQPANYLAWQKVLQQADTLLAHKEWVVGLHISTPNGQAGYMRLAQREYQDNTSSPVFNVIASTEQQASTLLNLGYQRALWHGLVQVDYQVTKNKNSNQVKASNGYEHSLGFGWEWRW